MVSKAVLPARSKLVSLRKALLRKIFRSQLGGLKLQSIFLGDEVGNPKVDSPSLIFIAQSGTQLTFKFGVDPYQFSFMKKILIVHL